MPAQKEHPCGSGYSLGYSLGYPLGYSSETGTKQHIDDDDNCPGQRETLFQTVRSPALSNKPLWGKNSNP